eukprot:TRINITY_DN13286_c0_g2_i2.p3 TRINITY_DN13286_c0_g2~~TRINITY_DN13286_c0_g2_i2.p3  ORF type:complete len:110 (+),score=26.67 TRINITY_DN13286_c0_g2_i2:658-987(+)
MSLDWIGEPQQHGTVGLNTSLEGVQGLTGAVGKGLLEVCESVNLCMGQLQESTDAISDVSIQLLKTMLDAVASAETAAEVSVEKSDKFIALCIELDSQMRLVGTLQSQL